MSRLAGTVINKTGYTAGSQMPIVDLALGGTFGHAIDWKSYNSDTPHVLQPMTVRVIEAPRGFEDLDEPEKWREALVACFERHARQWSGLNSTLTLDTAETEYGNAGEMIEAPKKMKRNRSQPQAQYIDKYGRPISLLHIGWGLNLLQDPETNVPNVVTREGVEARDFLLDYIGATVLFFTTDKSMRYIDMAWLVTGMFPKEFPPEEGKRDSVAGGDMLEFSISYTGITQTGNGVKMFAQKILNNMSLTFTNPMNRAAFVSEINADVLATDQTFQDQLEKMAADTVRY